MRKFYVDLTRKVEQSDIMRDYIRSNENCNTSKNRELSFTRKNNSICINIGRIVTQCAMGSTGVREAYKDTSLFIQWTRAWSCLKINKLIIIIIIM